MKSMIEGPAVRFNHAQDSTFFPFLIFVKIRKINPKALSEFW